MASESVLIGGKWQAATQTGTFQADNPATREKLPDVFPTSSWEDCSAALDAAQAAFSILRTMPVEKIGEFLSRYADLLDEHKQPISELASQETGLPVAPRLADVELPRTTGQLRQAAAAAIEGSWRMPTIDTKANIRSYYAGLGPVAVFGPNNFPLAFGSISGGDFAAAIAAGNPVIAKANPGHPATTRECAKLAFQAAQETGLPEGTVQLLYHMDYEVGERMIADPRLASVAFTGSRSAGMKLKEVADRAGKPIYLELSSINPVFILPGALQERGDEIAGELQTSALMAAGQFCTNPGLVVLLRGDATESLVAALRSGFQNAPVGTLLGEGVERNLQRSITTLTEAGAEVVAQSEVTEADSRFCHVNTLLRISGEQFLANPLVFQTEAFGNATLLVVVDDLPQAVALATALEGNLTGCVYSDRQGTDDEAYSRIVAVLRQKVGRLINDKMPTGVAVSSAMNHGGPFPSTGHPGFTAVGIPASIHRFAMLQCFDQVRPDRLPRELQDSNPTGKTWRLIDGNWTQADVT